LFKFSGEKAIFRTLLDDDSSTAPLLLLLSSDVSKSLCSLFSVTCLFLGDILLVMIGLNDSPPLLNYEELFALLSLLGARVL